MGFYSHKNWELRSDSEFMKVHGHHPDIVTPFPVKLEKQNQAAPKLVGSSGMDAAYSGLKSVLK